MNIQSTGALHAMVILLLLLHSIAAEPAVASVKLPYDRTCPVIYDNDYANDYVDWYLMALASAGDIRYRGISTSSSIAPYNRHMPADALDDAIATRTRIVASGGPVGCVTFPNRWPATGDTSSSPPRARSRTLGRWIRPAAARLFEKPKQPPPKSH